MLRTGRKLISRIKKGFTFVELLIVVILLGVVAALSIPNFRNSYYNFLLSDTSHNITYFMRYAQARSISERLPHRLNFNLDRSKYWLTKRSDSLEEQFERLKGKFGRVFAINDNLTLECESMEINFHPDGKIDKINIYLSNKSERFYTISTEAQSGYVQEFDYKR